ncbi:MAG: signal peptidase I [Minisyncoccia bacterium]
MHEERGENFFIELLKIGVPVVVIVILIRLFVAQPFIVSGSSMSPTFATGQYLLVDELTYRFEAPQRGDIIIFRYPKDPSEYFIKRIIGLPGETLNITPAAVYLVESNGTKEQLEEPYLVNQGNIVNETVTLGPGQYFVMGDNRPDSSDSRYWGDVLAQNIIGRAALRLFPLSKIGVLPGKAVIEIEAVASSSAQAAAALVRPLHLSFSNLFTSVRS